MSTTNALTVCQPYAHLIVIGEKRVENRVWPTSYRGTLLIHAGKSRAWMDDGDTGLYPEMAFGAIVGIAQLVECLRIDAIHSPYLPSKLAWLKDHEHTEGPWCWVLDGARRFATPITYRGERKIFKIPNEFISTASVAREVRP